MATIRGKSDNRRLAGIAGCTFLQVLTGANGIAFALPLLLWLTIALYRAEGGGDGWRRTAIGLAVATAIAIGLYPIGLSPITGSFDAGASLATTTS